MGNKIRVNITVDSETLERAKTKLKLFGGKLSTLFDAYLADFVSTMDKEASQDFKTMNAKMNEMEERMKKLESEQEKKKSKK